MSPSSISLGFHLLLLALMHMLGAVRYGERPRNVLDLYLPGKTSAGGAPVALFCHGGVWASGAFPALLQAPWTPCKGAWLRCPLLISAHAQPAAACGLFTKRYATPCSNTMPYYMRVSVCGMPCM